MASAKQAAGTPVFVEDRGVDVGGEGSGEDQNERLGSSPDVQRRDSRPGLAGRRNCR
jgi:hypothetical protein